MRYNDKARKISKMLEQNAYKILNSMYDCSEFEDNHQMLISL